MFLTLLRRSFFSLCLLIICSSVFSQITVSGTVYDITKRTPVEAVSVISTGGTGSITNASGRYTISVNESDSIYFSYLNKPTPKYPVLSIANLGAFEISIMIKVAELPSIFVKPRSYILDSLSNRKDYARIFNYKKPGVSSSLIGTPGSIGVGLNLAEFISMFNQKKIRRTLSFQNRLLQEEQDKYINHRYSKSLVRQLTKLPSPELEVFMEIYKPAYDVVLRLNELELGKYILDSYKKYKSI
ncbi:MAG TPA: hypothetical protein VF622_07585 [Segetibacter sp.]